MSWHTISSLIRSNICPDYLGLLLGFRQRATYTNSLQILISTLFTKDYNAVLFILARWLQACLKEELPATTELEESFTNGVTLAKLANYFAPKVAPLRKIYDKDLKRYMVSFHVLNLYMRVLFTFQSATFQEWIII